MPTQKIQPPTLFQRALGGHVLYNHVVVAESQKLIFISGQLARNEAGEIVGPKISAKRWMRPAARSPTWSKPLLSSPISTNSFDMSTFAMTIWASRYLPRLPWKSVALLIPTS
jgi:hypothetical protein